MSQLHYLLIILFYISTLVSLNGCNSSSQSGSLGFPPRHPTLEKVHCSKSRSFSSTISVTGRGMFEYRPATPSGLGDIASEMKPIRHAEVHVLDAVTNNLIQCAHTDSQGYFQLFLPSFGPRYRLEIQARANTDKVRASILKDPYSNSIHTIATNFISSEDIELGNIIASANFPYEAGAFNIFDQILITNEFLRENLDTETCSAIGCQSFNAAPKVVVYWKPGFNPGEYLGLGSISFYLASQSMLFILGGSHGDLSSSDTDHFDNSVIIHEYGHFLEDVFSKTDSPGGSHDGNSIIDPRLAWGEGWANFLQAAVLGEPSYIDTIGINHAVLFSVDLENADRDVAGTLGEGNFREFSVSRFLWDHIDPHPKTNQGSDDSGNESVQQPFAKVWTVMTNSDQGFLDSSARFRNIGFFHEVYALLFPDDDLSELFTLEKQVPDQRDYAAMDTDPGGSCMQSIKAANGSSKEDGTFDGSNLFASNDFYRFDHEGGELKVRLEYTTSMSEPADLDLYVYQQGYVFGESKKMAALSNEANDSGLEEIIEDLKKGAYLINVHVYTGPRKKGGVPILGGNSDYTLTVNGEEICP